jgi:prevent-host-death family protein
MTTLTATQARRQLPEMLNRAAYGGERIAIERRGKVLAAVVPVEDLELLQRLEDEHGLREAKKAIRDYEKHGGIAWEDLKKQLQDRDRK